MAKSKKFIRQLNIVIFAVSCLIVGAFFLPWAHGEGSLAKPVDDMSRDIQETDPSGITKGTVQTGRQLVDLITEFGTGKNLKASVSGFDIPKSSDEEIKKLGPVVNALYLIPASAVFFALIALAAPKANRYYLLILVISAALSVALFYQIPAFSKDTVFKQIRPGEGFWVTLHLFPVVGIVAFLRIITGLFVSTPRKKRKKQRI
jgi:hypothetical protein